MKEIIRNINNKYGHTLQMVKYPKDSNIYIIISGITKFRSTNSEDLESSWTKYMNWDFQ